MTQAGFTVGGDPAHPICPIMIGDARIASEFADEMLERGIYVIGFSFPVWSLHLLFLSLSYSYFCFAFPHLMTKVVPRGKARIRVQISAAHTEEDIDRAVHAFTEVARNKGIIE